MLQTHHPNPLLRGTTATTMSACLAPFIQITAKHQKTTGICLVLQYQQRLKVPLRHPEEQTQKHLKDK